MNMTLKNLVIDYNNSNYPSWEGIPPKTYSARITLETKLGETTTILSQEDIIAIMGVVCHRVSENMRSLAQTTATELERAVSGSLIEHIEETN